MIHVRSKLLRNTPCFCRFLAIAYRSFKHGRQEELPCINLFKGLIRSPGVSLLSTVCEASERSPAKGDCFVGTSSKREERKPRNLGSRHVERPTLISKFYLKPRVCEALGLAPASQAQIKQKDDAEDGAKALETSTREELGEELEEEEERFSQQRTRCRERGIRETVDILKKRRIDRMYILRDRDMSLVPIPGEPHHQYIIRRRRAKAEAQKLLKHNLVHGEPGDDWVRRRLGWLCRELPILKAYGIVKVLNGQRSWIKEDHINEIIEHLVKQKELKRAHRVLKWMRQQPWYKFDYELHNSLAYTLGQNDKVSRCRDIFDEILKNARIPKPSTFNELIKAYIRYNDDDYLNDAWKLYKQMIQLGLKASSDLREVLFNSLTCPSGRWLQELEELFENMKCAGQYINEEMYGKLLEINGNHGNHARVEALIEEMKEEDLELGLDVINAVLAACAKDGNVEKAEKKLAEMTDLGIEADGRSNLYLIRLFGVAQMPIRAWKIYEHMKGNELHINVMTYHALIDAMAGGLHEEKVLQLLSEVEKSDLKPLQPCFNSVMNMYLQMGHNEKVISVFNRGKMVISRPTHVAYNILIEAYKNTGQFDEAELAFLEMKKKGGAGVNARTCNLMLEIYGKCCRKDKVLEVYWLMSTRGYFIEPNVKVHVGPMIDLKQIEVLDKKRLKLTDDQREVIHGLLLGGAMMENPDNDNMYELHLEFNCKDKVRRLVKDHLFHLFGAWWKRDEESDNGTDHILEDKGKRFVRLETVSHSSLRFYANTYRPGGTPAIPRLIHRWLKPRTLAYWYMYGGRRCCQTGGIVLKSLKYPIKQIERVVKTLKARTIDCSRMKKKDGDVIRFEAGSAAWIWKLMEPHILDELKDELRPNVTVSDEEGSLTDDDDWEEMIFDKSEEMDLE